MRELKRANEILLAASSFFARELGLRCWRGVGVTDWPVDSVVGVAVQQRDAPVDGVV